MYWLSQSNPEHSLNMAMGRFAKAAGLISPRTGERLVLNPRRFRFSLATYMAEEGASAFHIAEILDHSDTQNVRVYVETASSIADQVAKATDAVLLPLIRRFQGRIVDSTETPAFEGLPNQVIPAIAPHLAIFHSNVGGTGMCGRDVRKDGLCRLLPPVSCYLCPSFAALEDRRATHIAIRLRGGRNSRRQGALWPALLQGEGAHSSEDVRGPLAYANGCRPSSSNNCRNSIDHSGSKTASECPRTESASGSHTWLSTSRSDDSAGARCGARLQKIGRCLQNSLRSTASAQRQGRILLSRCGSRDLSHVIASEAPLDRRSA